MSKKSIKIISVTAAVIMSLVVIIAPIGLILGTAFLTPSQYSKTFYGALDLKYERLTSIQHDKIVVLGGSSVAFGLDSALIEKYTGMPVVNFGLYGDLGTRLMLDLSRDHINEGDIVILAPELSAQTLSMYFSWETTLKACDDNMLMLGALDRTVDEWLFSIGGFYKLASAKLAYSINKNTPDPEDVYNSDNFNKYGDIDPSKFPRENNIMKNQYLPGESYLVNLDESIVESEFIEYLNAYIRECEEKGASVYFSWCPVNDLSLADGSLENSDAFENYFRENLDCEIISDINDYVIDSHYFYDTNLHLNDAGVQVRTIRLLKDLLSKLDPAGSVTVTEEEPPMPEYKYSAIYEGEDDPNAAYFVYEQLSNGAYKIIGLSELGKAQSTLTLPLGYRAPEEMTSYKVTLLDTDIFEGSACSRLIIPEDTNIGAMVGSFKGAGGLERLDIYTTAHNELAPPDSFSGTGSGFEIHVPTGSGYDESYNWDPFSEKIKDDL